MLISYDFVARTLGISRISGEYSKKRLERKLKESSFFLFLDIKSNVLLNYRVNCLLHLLFITRIDHGILIRYDNFKESLIISDRII